MLRHMLTFETDQFKFSYRIVGVALHEGHVLLHRAETDDFWALPGGRAEALEPAAETLRREMSEELGASVRVGRLLWVVENFFDYRKPHHELGFYFAIEFESDSYYDLARPLWGREGGLRLIFCWFPVDELDELPLYPSFLRHALRAPPATTQHVVHVDQE